MPKILESEALTIARSIDQAPETDRPWMLDLLGRYQQQQRDEGEPDWPSVERARVERETNLRGMFESPEKITYDPGPFSQNPQEAKMLHANMALLSARYQKEPAEVASRYDFLLNDYARQKLGASEDVDTAKFYALAQKAMQKVKLREDTQREGMSAALRGEDGVKALAAWQAKNADRAKDDAGLFMRGYQQALEQDGEMLPIADRLLPLLEAGASKREGQVFDQTKAQELGGMIEQLAGMKKAQRKSVYRSIAARIEAAGYDQKGFWSQMLGELDKGLYRMEGTIGTSAGIASDVATAVAGAQTRIPDTFDGSSVSMPVLSDEEQQALLRQRDYRQRIGNVQQEIMQIVSGELDPVRPTLGWLNDTIETGAIKGPGAVAPFMAASALLGPYGAGLVFTADFAEQNRRDLLAMGMDNDKAMEIGVIAAPLQAAVEVLSNMVQLGRFTKLQKVLAGFTKPIGGGAGLAVRYVQNSLISLATEFTEEQLQENFIVPAVQEIVGALAEDVEEVDWSFYKTRAAESTPELLSVLAPMALVFGGVMTAADAKLSRTMTQNVDLMMSTGMDQAQAVEVASQPTHEQRIKKGAELWSQRKGTKASMEEAQKKLAAQYRTLAADSAEAVKELEKRGVLPRLLPMQGGEYRLTFNDGSTADFKTREEALGGIHVYIRDRMQRSTRALRETIDTLTKNLEQGREFALEISPEAMPADEAVKRGIISPQALQERAEQGAILDATTLIENSVLTGKALGDEEAPLMLFGMSKNEWYDKEGRAIGMQRIKDDILRTTMRLWDGASPLTLIEEKTEGDAKVILSTPGKRQWMLDHLRDYEDASGDKLFTSDDNAQINDKQLIEAWSHMAQSYFVAAKDKVKGRTLGRYLRDIEEAELTAAMQGRASWWQAVVNRAQKLGELKAAGKLGADVVAELEKQLGIDSQVKHEQGAMQEAQNVADEVAQHVDTSGYSEANPGPNGETFSISSKELRVKIEVSPDSTTLGNLGITEGFHANHGGEVVPDFAPRASKQGRKGQYAGFYLGPAIDEVSQYGQNVSTFPLNPNTPVKVLRRPGQVERITPEMAAAWRAEGFSVVVGPAIIPSKIEIATLSANVLNTPGPNGETFSIIQLSDAFQQAGKFYRIVHGEAAFRDLIESGMVRTNAASKVSVGASLMDRLRERPTAFPSFSKDYAAMHYAGADANHFIIVTDDASLQPSTNGRHSKGKTYFPTNEKGEHLTSLPAQAVDVFRHIGGGMYQLVYNRGKLISNEANPGPNGETFAAQARAKSGGQIGPNGEWYPGGAFIATTQMPKKVKERLQKLAQDKPSGIEVAQRVFEPRKPGMFSPYARLAGVVMGPSGNLNEAYLSNAANRIAPEYNRQAREAVARWNAGERQLPINEFPLLIGANDAAAALAGGFAISGDIVEANPWLKEMVEGFNQLRAIPADASKVVQMPDGAPETFSLGKVTPAQDAEYMAAVEAGDMEKAQRMVDEAAKSAGLSDLLFHGTDSEFTEFDPARAGSRTRGPKAKLAFWFTESERHALERGSIAMPVFLRYSNPLTIKELTDTFDAGDIIEKANAIGHDAVIFEKLDDLEDSSKGVYSVALVVNDGVASQIKSADPVTRDDSGNVIPLSQRFNPADDRITYSLRVTPAQDAEYMAAVEAGDMEKAQRMVDEAAKAAIESNPRNAVNFGRFLSKSEYESVREQIQPLPRKVFYVGNVEVIRNPTGEDIRGMTNEERSARGGRRSVDPDTRFTHDNYGNTWRWKATGGMHSMIEPSISKQEGVVVNQNNGIPYHSDLVKDAIRSGEYIPSMTLAEYPNYADFVKPSSADPVTRDDAGNVIPLSQRFNPADDRITYSLRPGDFASRVEAMFSPFQRSPEARLVMARVAKDRALRLGNELIEKANVIRTMGSIDREARVRAALAEDKAVQDYLDGLTPAARQTLEWQPADLQDDPLVAAMLDFGKLMSKTTALQRGKLDLKMGDFDGAPWLPPSFYSKGAGIMPDQMAQAMFDAGLLPDAYTDTLWAELSKRIEATRKDKAAHREAVQAFKDAKKAARDAAAKEAGTWADNAKKQAGSSKAQRDRIKAWLRVLDGILAAAPPEVRARVGGFVKMAGIATDEAALRYLEDRVAKLNVELEKWLKKEYSANIKKKLVKFGSDRGKRGVMEGRTIASVTEQIDYADDFSKMSKAAQDVQIDHLEAVISDALSTPEQVDIAIKKLGIAEAFYDFENQEAEALSAVSDWLNAITSAGRDIRKALDEDRREYLGTLRTDGITSILGVPQSSQTDANNRQENIKGSLLKQMLERVKGFINSVLPSTVQQLEDVFGVDSTVVNEFAPRIWTAANRSTDIKSGVEAQRRAMLATVFKTKSTLKQIAMLSKLQQSKMSGVFIKEGRKTETVTVPVDILERIQDGSMTAKAAGLTQAEADEALAQWAGASTRTKNATIERETFAGTQKELQMSEMQALNYLLHWNQDAVRARMENHGWTQASIDQLNTFMSDETKAIGRWMSEMYATAGRALVDPVYRRIFHAPLPMVKNFAPTYYETPGNDSTMAIDAQQNTSGIMASFTKARRPHNYNVRQVDAMTAFLSHFEHVSHWVSFVELLRDMKAVMSAVEVQNAIIAHHGPAAAAALTRRINDTANQGNDQAWSLHEVSGWFNRINQARVFKALAWKISPVVKQTSAFFNPMLADVPAHAYTIGLSKLLTGKLDVEAMWNSDNIQRRVTQGFSAEARIAMQANGNGPIGAVAIKLMQNGMLPMQYTDAAWSTVGAAIAWDYYRGLAVESGQSAAMAEQSATKAVERMLATAAQPADLVNRSLVEGSSNPLVKGAWMFASESRKNLAIEFYAAKRLLTGKSKNKGMDAQRLIVAHVVMAMTTQLMSGLLALALGDDDDKEREWSAGEWAAAILAGPINGLFVVGDGLRYLSRLALGLRTFRSLPPYLQIVEDAGSAGSHIDDLFNGDDEEAMKEINRLSGSVGFVLSAMFGPAAQAADVVLGNPLRDMAKALND